MIKPSTGGLSGTCKIQAVTVIIVKTEGKNQPMDLENVAGLLQLTCTSGAVFCFLVLKRMKSQHVKAAPACRRRSSSPLQVGPARRPRLGAMVSAECLSASGQCAELGLGTVQTELSR